MLMDQGIAVSVPPGANGTCPMSYFLNSSTGMCDSISVGALPVTPDDSMAKWLWVALAAGLGGGIFFASRKRR